MCPIPCMQEHLASALGPTIEPLLHTLRQPQLCQQAFHPSTGLLLTETPRQVPAFSRRTAGALVRNWVWHQGALSLTYGNLIAFLVQSSIIKLNHLLASARSTWLSTKALSQHSVCCALCLLAEVKATHPTDTSAALEDHLQTPPSPNCSSLDRLLCHCLFL